MFTCFAFDMRVMCLNELQTKLLISNRGDTCVNTLRIFRSRIQITRWWDLLTWKVLLGSAKWILGTVGLHIPKGRSDPWLQDLCNHEPCYLGYCNQQYVCIEKSCVYLRRQWAIAKLDVMNYTHKMNIYTLTSNLKMYFLVYTMYGCTTVLSYNS